MLQKKEVLYTGKAKTMYATDNPASVIMSFRDDLSAFNGIKLATMSRKGLINNYINAHLMTYLENAGIRTQFEAIVGPIDSQVKTLKMVPIECVIRNRAAGGICKRLGLERGQVLTPPTFEFFLKDDALGDPMVNESHILTFGWTDKATMEAMVRITHQVNDCLAPYFASCGIELVDFKLEFGYHDGALLLGDEITPDGCRLWDMQTQKILDKDRFRQDLGEVIESYEEIASRLGIKLPG